MTAHGDMTDAGLRVLDLLTVSEVAAYEQRQAAGAAR